MNYQLIGDSAIDLTDDYQNQLKITTIPFTIQVDGQDYIDNDRSKIPALRQTMNEAKEVIKTACPSPYEYGQAFDEEADGIFIITISSKLSGSYNSAKLAAKDFMEKHPNKKVYVFDSKSASAGQTNLGFYLADLINQDLGFDEIVEKTEAYIRGMKTFFILENLHVLVRNGRIKKSAGLILKTLNIKPIMQGVDGEIELFEINRGFKKALDKLAKALGRFIEYSGDQILYISHSNGKQKAELFKEKVEALYNFKKIVIVPTGGLSSAYADDGGIVISFHPGAPLKEES